MWRQLCISKSLEAQEKVQKCSRLQRLDSAFYLFTFNNLYFLVSVSLPETAPNVVATAQAVAFGAQRLT